MLILSRYADEEVVLYTSDGPITLRVTAVEGNRAKLGFAAPASVVIKRRELVEPIEGKAERALCASIREFRERRMATV